MEKSFIEINYTKKDSFIHFNEDIKKYLIKNKSKKIVYITDYIYPITKPQKDSYEIIDHINLSGFNPLKGPSFISLTNAYKSKKGIVVAHLKEDVQPNPYEIKILLKSNIKAYCYNLVPTVIFAVSLGFKIKAFGVIKTWQTLL